MVTALRLATALAVGTALCATGCSGASTSSNVGTASKGPVPVTSRARPTTPVRSAVLQIGRESWVMPAPLSRAVVFPVGGSLEIAGGLGSDGSTTAALRLINPQTGASSSVGSLIVPTHDAAGAPVAGRRYLFGGGQAKSEATVQGLTSTGSVVLASLPQARSDLVAVEVRGVAYLVGGYDGTSWAATVLRTADGRHFAAAARLPVPVRYPAVAVVGSVIWVFGGQAQGGPTSVVQRIDVLRGQAIVAARMSHPLTDASAVVLGGRVFLCGGSVGGLPTSRVQQFLPRTLRFRAAGKLPQPVQDASSVVLNGVGYLLGGETPRPTASVATLRLVTAPAARAGS